MGKSWSKENKITATNRDSDKHLNGKNCIGKSKNPNYTGNVKESDHSFLKSMKHCNDRKASTDSSHANIDINKQFVDIGKLESIDHAALRLRQITHSLNDGHDIPKAVLIRNMEYCLKVLECTYSKLAKNASCAPSEDDITSSHISGTLLNEEIKTWIEETFTKKRGNEVPERKGFQLHFRTIVKMVQASLVFDKLFQKRSTFLMQESFSPQVITCLKNVDKWAFNVHELNSISFGEGLKCVLFKLLAKYDLMRKLKIFPKNVTAFVAKIQKGYSKFKNPYHNVLHAADITQTLHVLLNESGLVAWMTDLEIFTLIIAAVIHDVEHTGTTNAFHIYTRSPLALLYNDKSVLEQHHLSTAFRIMQDPECDIMCNLSRQEYQDCRAMMIEVVLATDMSQHFENLRQMEVLLERPRWLEKTKTMCLLVHAADISNPSKPWKLHYPWAEKLMLEFFAQGDREKLLELPISPLCDRSTSKVAQSQIGFIDFILVPTFTTLFNVFSELQMLCSPQQTPTLDQKNPQNNLRSTFGEVQANTSRCSADANTREVARRRLSEIKETCFGCISYNREEWLRRSKIEDEFSLRGDKALDKHINLVTPVVYDHGCKQQQRRGVTGVKLTPLSRLSSPMQFKHLIDPPLHKSKSFITQPSEP